MRQVGPGHTGGADRLQSLLKRIGVNTKSARFELRRFGSLLGKDHRVLLDGVADGFVRHADDRLQQIRQPHVFERRIDPDDDAVHVQRFRRRQRNGLTGVRIDGDLRSRRRDVGIDQEIDALLIRVTFRCLFREELQNLRQRHAIEKRLVQDDSVQFVSYRLSSGAGVRQIGGRKRIGQSFAPNGQFRRPPRHRGMQNPRIAFNRTIGVGSENRENWPVGFGNLPADEIISKTLAVPHLISALQSDSALEQHIAGPGVDLRAPGGQNRAPKTDHKIVRNDGNACSRIVMNLSPFNSLDFNLLVS